jgi:hypothetical protein
MKLTPMYSFLTRISPSLSLGTGRSVLYSKTSVPPVLLIRTAAMVEGSEVEAMVDVKRNWKGDEMQNSEAAKPNDFPREL